MPSRRLSPPMGWNSWDCFGTTVTEPEVLANARVMSSQLLAFGWDTVVVDIAWYDPTARAHGYNSDAPVVLDGYGRQLPAPNRFPSGFAALAAEVHALGLKFGLHIMRGIPRRAVELDLPIFGTSWTAAEVADRDNVCAWNPDNFGLNHDHPGAQAYYDSQVAQFAAWGVDFIKADDMLAPYHHREIESYAEAIRRSGRDITLSLSPGTWLSTDHVDHLRENAAMWRISDDLWDRWEDIHAQFARLARWAPFQQPGGWADADMLPLGHIGIRAERGDDRASRLTLDEQKTLLTLWSMARSPLMMGGDLPTTSPETVALLKNPALAELLTTSYNNREITREPIADGELIVWRARGEHCSYEATFWTGPTPHAFPTNGPDLWGATDAHIPAHGVRWFKLPPTP
ncbi:glycoside hydrolase family 27 protein [Kribbella sp. NPDC026611]|uniref:glycoside hydrolase family 27 protein n=1 Tax=Kribbella sp. NPDC026611 TaxID=3154911 RepID=UPI003404E6A4